MSLVICHRTMGPFTGPVPDTQPCIGSACSAWVPVKQRPGMGRCGATGPTRVDEVRRSWPNQRAEAGYPPQEET